MLQMIQPVICQVNCLEIKIYNVTTNLVSKGESFMRKQAFFFFIVMLKLIFIKIIILTSTHHFAWFSLDRVMKLWLLSSFMSELKDEVYTHCF